MTRRVLPFVFILLCSAAASQELPISIDLVGKPLVEARSRQVVSLVLRVANKSMGVRTFSIDPALPKGWKGLVQDEWFFLDPGAAETKIATFLVPSGARAGDYPIRCWLRDKDGIFFSTFCDLTVRVSKELDLELVLLESPRHAIAGNEYTALFAVSNSGNADILVEAAIRSSMSLPFVLKGLESGQGNLLPSGEAREFSVTVKTSADIARAMTHQLQVDMRFADADTPQAAVDAEGKGGDRARRKRATATVELVPLSRNEAALFYTLPFSSATAAEVLRQGGWGASLKETLKAEGGLDEEGRHRIALGLSKRIGTDGDPLFDPADRYSLEYSGSLAEAGLGDLSYGLSPLLGEKRFGRGAKASLTLDSFKLGALYFSDAWSGGAQDLAATAGWTAPAPSALPDSRYRIGLTLHSPLTDRLSLGLLQEYSPFDGIRAAVDVVGQAAIDGSLSAASYAHTEGKLGLFGWNARFGIGSPLYSGKYSDLMAHSLQASFSPLGEALTLRGGYSLRQDNYLLDQERPSAARDAWMTAGAEGRLPSSKTLLRLEWEHARHDDRLPARLFDTSNDKLRFTAKQPLAPFDLEAQAAVGIGRDMNGGTASYEQDHRLALGYALSSSANASLQLRYAGFRADGGDGSDQILAQAGLRLPVGRAELNLGALNGYRFARGLYLGTRLAIDARFAYSLPRGHSLSSRATFGLSTETESASFNASLGVAYSLPFEVPIGRKADTAIVSGKILEATTRLPVKGALLRLDGLAAIADAEGAFVFYVAHTGSEFLFLDPSSIAEGLVPMADMPMELKLEKGKGSTVEILLAKGCSISGKASGFGFKDSSGAFVRSDLQDGSGTTRQREKLFDLGGLIIEISNGGQRLRKLTGADGSFRFQDLRPGRYSVRVIGGKLPERFRLESDSVEVELSGGSASIVEFRAIEEQRSIKMQELSLTVGDQG